MREYFQSKLRGSLKSIPDFDTWYFEKKFMYTWFMSCFFHDATSYIEISDRTSCQIEIEELKRLCLNNQIYQEVPHRYENHPICNYFAYQKAFAGEQDHGIIGGCHLFAGSLKNYEDHFENHRVHDDSLHWCESHRPHYAYVADAIITHNMWTVDKQSDPDTAKKYEDHGLDELIVVGNEKKLSLKDHPLCFMLCLLDTIELTKRLVCLQPKEIAENLFLEKLIPVSY